MTLVRAMRCLRIPAAAALVLTAGMCPDPNYNDMMRDQVARAIGGDFKGYYFFSYPTNNFGVATAYEPKGGKADDATFLCDTWNCLGISAMPADSGALMNVNGFAAVGDNGGRIALTEKQSRAVALNAVLPEIYRVINVAGGFDAQRVRTSTLQLGPAFPRKLRRIEMTRYINGLPTNHPLRNAFDRGDLAMVVADVVVSSIKVDIKVDQDEATKLDAKFDPNLPDKLKLFDGGSLGVKMSSATQGTYTFDVTRPVIIARLIKHQPMAGVLADDNDSDWRDWLPQAADEPVRTQANTMASQGGN